MTVQAKASCWITAALLCAVPMSVAAQAPDRCSALAGVSDARGVVCRVVAEERTFILAQQKSPPAANSCALVRTHGRLERLLGEVVGGTGVLPVYFTVRTVGGDGERRELFADEPDAVVVDVEEGTSPPGGACVAGEQRDAVLQVVAAVGRAVHGYNQPFLQQGAGQLRKLANTWSWVISDGFGQYPWERFLNDVVHRNPPGPGIIEHLPRYEWVLLHPSVALAMSGLKELRTSRGQTAFLIEPLGFIRYRFNIDAETRAYWGASALVVATENQPPAIGALLRFNKYSFGVARHLSDNSAARGRWTITATVELLERLQPPRKGVREAGEKAGAR